MAFSPISHVFTVKTHFINYETDEELDYGNCVTAIAIKKDYTVNIFPLFVISLRLTLEQREYLAKNNFYLSLKIFRVSNIDNDSREDIANSTDPITDKIVLDLLLKPFDTNKMIAKIKDDTINENDNTKEEEFVEYTINCIPKEKLKINNSILNECYSDANLNEISINMISSVYNGDVYFQESFNTNRYESLVVPPSSLMDALRYVQKYYKIYKNTLNVFFDYNKAYIYDIFDLDREFTNNCSIEVSNITDSSQEKFRNIYIDGDNIEKYYDNTIPIISNKDTYRYSTGEKVIYGSHDDNFNLVTRSYDMEDSNNKQSEKKIRFNWNNLKDQTFETQIKQKAYTFTQLNFFNIDPSLFNPDTLFDITGNLTNEYNGQYILLGSDTFFSTKDRIIFTNSINLNLAKI